MRAIWGCAIVLVVCVSPAPAGIYSSIDSREDARWSRDYYNVFRPVLDKWRAVPRPKGERESVLWQRYVLLENLAGDKPPKLDTLQQQINYSSMLIRRGRAIDAVRYLQPIVEEHQDNFLVRTQFAAAHFLTGNRDFEVKAPKLMERALKKWPASWGDLKDNQRAFLESFGWDEFDFQAYRDCEELFERLIVSRLKEKELLEQKKQVDEVIDPLFGPKDKPVRFVNEKGEYEAAHIAKADKDHVPRKAVEYVEQLLIWMPNDDRLLWLLAETFNASAMEHPKQDAKSLAVLNAYKIFERLTDLKNPAPMKFARQEIQNRMTILENYLEKNPVREIEPEKNLPDPPEVEMTRAQWWRAQAIVFGVGVAVGLFALWQVQEVRRRRQARAAAKG